MCVTIRHTLSTLDSYPKKHFNASARVRFFHHVQRTWLKHLGRLEMHERRQCSSYIGNCTSQSVHNGHRNLQVGHITTTVRQRTKHMKQRHGTPSCSTLRHLTSHDCGSRPGDGPPCFLSELFPPSLLFPSYPPSPPDADPSAPGGVCSPFRAPARHRGLCGLCSST